MVGLMLKLSRGSVGQGGHHVVWAMVAMLELPRVAQIPLLPRGVRTRSETPATHLPLPSGCWGNLFSRQVCKTGMQQQSKQHHKAPCRRPQAH